MSLRGHFWTLAPFLRYSVAPPKVPASTEWQTTCADPVVGEITLTGDLSQRGDSDTLVVIIHGLGGCSTSYYAMQAAMAVRAAGLDSLRLNLRGADRRGDDYYHAGLTEDLAATLRSPVVAQYERILILAYSLGGNMALRYLSGTPDPRVRAAAAICSPVDLAKGARAIDRLNRTPYRRHVLRGLKEIYQEVAARSSVPLRLEDARRIDSIEQWDEEVISPRHGFAGAEDYWAKTSACYVLGDIRAPTLLIAEEQDPMVRIDDVRPWIERADNVRHLITNRGGHVGFPQKVDLGMGTRGTFEDQVIQWMLAPS